MTNSCNCRSAWCVLDVWLHRAWPHYRPRLARWICDRHDKIIWGNFGPLP
jgi:hypothetical protein